MTAISKHSLYKNDRQNQACLKPNPTSKRPKVYIPWNLDIKLTKPWAKGRRTKCTFDYYNLNPLNNTGCWWRTKYPTYWIRVENLNPWISYTVENPLGKHTYKTLKLINNQPISTLSKIIDRYHKITVLLFSICYPSGSNSSLSRSMVLRKGITNHNVSLPNNFLLLAQFMHNRRHKPDDDLACTQNLTNDLVLMIMKDPNRFLRKSMRKHYN